MLKEKWVKHFNEAHIAVDVHSLDSISSEDKNFYLLTMKSWALPLSIYEW